MGGMGAVWRADDTMLGRDVAIKEIIFPPLVSAEEQRVLCARLAREARAAARLSHPAVITVHDVVEDSGLPWIVMELFDGASLQQIILSRGPLPYRQVAEIGLHVLDALSAAHSAGVVHRDVKPSNVLVNRSRVKLTDFGAAAVRDDPTLTTSGHVIGTPAFMAPEHARGTPVPESDLWSLGATLYMAVEGRLPFSGEDNVAVLTAVLTGSPDPPRLAGPLGPVLIGLLRTDPAERLTAGQTASMLRKLAVTSPSNWTPSQGQVHAPSQRHTPPGRPGKTLTRSGALQEAPHRPTPSPGTPAAPDVRPPARGQRAGIPDEWRPLPGSRHAGPEDESSGTRSRRRPIILSCLAGLVIVVIVIVVVVTQTVIPSYTPTRTIAYPSGVDLASGVVALSPDGKTLAVAPTVPGYAINGVYLWNTANGDYLGSISAPSQAGLSGLAFSPDGTLLAAATSDGPDVWDVRTHREISSLGGGGNSVTAVAFSPDGDIVAYADDAGIIEWSARSWHQIGSFGASGGAAATSLAFSPDGKELAVGYDDGSAQIWNASDDKLLFNLSDQASQQYAPSEDGITEVAFSPDGRTLAGGDFDGSTYLWNTATGREAATLIDPGSPITISGIAFSSNTTLATADYDQSTTNLWDISTRQVIGTLNNPVLAVAASTRGSMLATIGNAGSAYLWPTSPTAS